MVNGSKHTLSQWLTVLKHTHTLLCVDGTRSGKLTRSPLALAPMYVIGGRCDRYNRRLYRLLGGLTSLLTHAINSSRMQTQYSPCVNGQAHACYIG